MVQTSLSKHSWSVDILSNSKTKSTLYLTKNLVEQGLPKISLISKHYMTNRDTIIKKKLVNSHLVYVKEVFYEDAVII